MTGGGARGRYGVSPMSELVSGMAGSAWAALWLASWVVTGWWWVRGWLATDWPWIERLALTWAVASGALIATTLIAARFVTPGFFGPGTLSMLLGWGCGVAAIRGAKLRPEPPASPGSSRLIAILALGSAPIIAIAVTNFSGDWSAHYWNAAAIQNGVLPLAYPTDPDLEIPYHYAIDLLAAVLWRAIPIDREWIFDSLSIVAWLTSALLGARLVLDIRPLRRERALGFVLGFALLGGGLLWLVAPLAENAAARSIARAGMDAWLFTAGAWGPPPRVAGAFVNFPTLHYFFNMPVAAGLPLGLAGIAMYGRFALSRERAHGAAATLCLGALSIAHIAFFGVICAAIGVTALVAAVANRIVPGSEGRGRWLGSLAVGAGVLALGVLQGGIFAWPQGIVGSDRMVWLQGLQIDTLGLPLYYAATFGVPGALGVVGAVFAIRRGNLVAEVLTFTALLGVVLPLVVWYTVAPIDNLKFLTLAAIALGILAAAGFEDLRDLLPQALGRAALPIVMATSMATPLLHVVARMQSAPDYVLAVRGRTSVGEIRVQPLFAERWPGAANAARWLRENMTPSDRVILLPSGDREAGVALALAGRFSAEARYDGYPGIAIAPDDVERRKARVARVKALDPSALCESPPLLLYVRQGRMRGTGLLELQAAEARSQIRVVYASDEVGGRHVIYRACPNGAAAP